MSGESHGADKRGMVGLGLRMASYGCEASSARAARLFI